MAVAKVQVRYIVNDVDADCFLLPASWVPRGHAPLADIRDAVTRRSPPCPERAKCKRRGAVSSCQTERNKRLAGGIALRSKSLTGRQWLESSARRMCTSV